MAQYSPPVDQLLTFGDAHDTTSEWPDYRALGLGPEHIPDLIRMATDPDLTWADSDTLEVWGPIHAWRALGQLRAESAVAPLLGLVALRNEEGGYDDWTGEELPEVFGMIGPSAIPALKMYMAEHAHEYNDYPGIAATALREIAQRHPETRTEVVAALTNQLAKFDTNVPEFNADIINELTDLKAVESAATIKAAFFARKVDLLLMGQWNDVKEELGLDPSIEVPGPEPAVEPQPELPFVKEMVSLLDQLIKPGAEPDRPMVRPPLLSPPTFQPLKPRSNKAAKAKRKQEKKSRKLNRKRK